MVRLSTWTTYGKAQKEKIWGEQVVWTWWVGLFSRVSQVFDER